MLNILALKDYIIDNIYELNVLCIKQRHMSPIRFLLLPFEKVR